MCVLQAQALADLEGTVGGEGGGTSSPAFKVLRSLVGAWLSDATANMNMWVGGPRGGWGACTVAHVTSALYECTIAWDSWACGSPPDEPLEAKQHHVHCLHVCRTSFDLRVYCPYCRPYRRIADSLLQAVYRWVCHPGSALHDPALQRALQVRPYVCNFESVQPLCGSTAALCVQASSIVVG